MFLRVFLIFLFQTYNRIIGFRTLIHIRLIPRSKRVFRDLQLEGRVCYYCGQEGHVKTNCPSLKATGGIGAPQAVAATPLRAFDGRVGQAESEGSRGKVHQLIGEEVHTTPNG